MDKKEDMEKWNVNMGTTVCWEKTHVIIYFHIYLVKRPGRMT